MSDLMVSHNQFLLFGEDTVFLLVTGNDDLDALLQIRLGCESPAVADCP